MSETDIDFEVVAPHVGVVTLARPPVNALNRQIRQKLISTMDSVQTRDDVRVVILTANGRVFSAGADIKEKQALGDAPGAHESANRLTRDSFFCLLDSSKPVIAAVNGATLGAGFVMAACCDMIIAADSAFFAMPEIDVGLGGGASFLQRILPLSKVRRMTLTGERVPATEMYRLGAVEACVPDEELLPTALGIATTIASKSPLAVRIIRESFLPVESLDLREGFKLEQRYTTALSLSDDAAEARLAFIEKRDPVF